MSHEASLWAWKAVVKTSSQRLVLASMADRADEQARCFPSITRLASDTLLNRKTIIKVNQELIDLGLIADTGERVGRTGQVIVWQLIGVELREGMITTAEGCIPKQSQNRNSSKNGTIANSNSPKTGTVPKTEPLEAQTVPETEPLNTTKGDKESQNRNSSKNGTVPNFPPNGPNFSAKQSQKRDTESVIEPVKESLTDTDTDAGAVAADDSQSVEGEFIPASEPPTLVEHLNESGAHPAVMFFAHNAEKQQFKSEDKRRLWDKLTRYGFDKYVTSALMNFYRDHCEQINQTMLARCERCSDPEQAAREWLADDEQFQNSPDEIVAQTNRALREWRELNHATSPVAEVA